MDLFYEPHRAILKKLLDYQVDFMMIGGYAVNYYGYNRATGDLDLWLKPTEDNKEKFIRMLEGSDFDIEGIKFIKTLDFSQAEVFCIGQVPARIDFLTKVTGVNYEDADKNKIIADVEDMKIPILHLNHLIMSKISNERTKDKLDVEELQKIQQMKKKD